MAYIYIYVMIFTIAEAYFSCLDNKTVENLLSLFQKVYAFQFPFLIGLYLLVFTV